MLTYREALRRIFVRTNYERGDRPPYAERYWRLDRVRELLQQLGNPHEAFRSVHIAGTKGKGSTTAMVDSILRAANYRTGMYTSPHLHTFRERIRICGELIPEQDVIALIRRMLPILDERPEVTVFEIITAMAMLYYAERGVDIGVFEVGLGGRLDATNVLRPLVSVITSISMDHEKVLGNTLEDIAREKAGIVKTGIPVVASPQKRQAMGVIEETCARLDAPLTQVGWDWEWRLLEADLAGQRFTVCRPDGQSRYEGLRIPLLGMHQLENACTAVAAIEVLNLRGLEVKREAVYEGLATVVWPGRLEILGRRPLVVVDGAHNTYSVECLLRALEQQLSFRRLILVFGAGTTHKPQELLRILLPAAAKAYVTRSRHTKAAPPQELREQARVFGYGAEAVDTVRAALAKALDDAGREDLVLATGSLFVVAEAREAWAKWNGLPALPSDPPGVYG